MSQTSDPSSPSRRSESTSLHALAAIARRMGLDTSHAELRRNYALPNQEPDTRLLIAIARDLGLTGKMLKLKFKDLKSIRKSLPAMLRVSDGVALILEAVREHPTSGLVAVVRDPTGGDDVTTVVDEAKLSAIWHGEVILFKRKHGITDEEQPFSLRWVLGLSLNQRKLLLDLSLGSVVSIIFALIPIIAMKVVIDRVIPNHSLSTLEVLVGGFTLLVIFETMLFAIRQRLTEVITARIDSRLNLYVFEKILKLPLAYFETHPAGMTMSKIGRLWQLRSFVIGKLFGTYLDAIPLLGLVPLLFFLNSQLASYVCFIALVVFFVVMAFLKPIALRHAEVVKTEQARHTHLIESIHGMRTIKALTLEGRRRREWDEHTAATTLAKYKLGITASYPQTFTIPLERLMFTGGLCLGAFLLITSPTPDTAGGLAAFVILSGRIGQPLVKLAQLQLELAEARGSIGELATIMNVPGEEERAGSGMRQPIQGAIAFQQVRFRYSAGSPYALDGVSFSVPAGTVLGVMGRSGSGKTTITRLLQRLSTSYDGMIKVDGMDLREINLQHLRTNVGIVLQENFLFSGTIRDNISIAKPDASLADIVRVAQLAGAEEFIERMPRGYDTWINEGASNLSGGQKQRLAIARALLTDPPVLLLDEATSALDAESEAIINANLKRIAKGRTVISISHRLSTLIDSDAILVMERGALYDMGTHDELLERCDIYQQLWHQQNRHIERASTRNKPVAAIGQDSAA